MFIGLFFFALFWGFLAMLVERHRGSSGALGCFLGLFLGPIGLLVCLLDKGHQCPMCKKGIDKKALVCPYCRSEISEAKRRLEQAQLDREVREMIARADRPPGILDQAGAAVGAQFRTWFGPTYARWKERRDAGAREAQENLRRKQ